MTFAKPFLKWAGGKDKLLKQLEEYYPKELIPLNSPHKDNKINNYIEPFLGGGATFFYISQEYSIDNFFLSDSNKDLIITYQKVRDNLYELIHSLEHIQSYYNESVDKRKFYIEIRDAFNADRNSLEKMSLTEEVDRATSFVFLNKACFNGMYRVNAKGEFNTSFGKREVLKLFDKDNLEKVSTLLKRATIKCCNYSECYDSVLNNSFVYLDPPYRPLSKTSSFTAYSESKFNDAEQVKLAKFFEELDENKKAKVMMSNSYTNDSYFENLYSGFNINKVYAGRAISGDGTKRGKIPELVITNYI